ncbi:MAG: SIMPL domain-containing protein [Bdellovibrionota bacterium]
MIFRSVKVRSIAAALLATFYFSTGTAVRAEPSASTGDLNEIAVTGDAPFSAGPDSVRISFRLDQTSATAQDAENALDARNVKIAEVVKSVLPSAGLMLRGEKFVGGSDAPTGVRSGSPVTVQRTIAITSGDLTKTGRLIDAVLQVGGIQLTDVSFSVVHNTKPNDDAVALATARAREKAERVAQSLGATLGPVLSVVVTEEPEGEALRAQLRDGENVADLGDKSLHVYANVRFALIKK